MLRAKLLNLSIVVDDFADRGASEAGTNTPSTPSTLPA